ncbi:DUF1552 domain-containing protein [Bremerella alba]|uniref:DUF1552 domain-containing protein n=1 Tax=Bremerella alba TaxID=980252 RepID=A0A7V9A9U0_9BACT|nr:DUF1552 domain-containing protein [Bremerella alba]MBA2117827.1 hypothetical protein [Bremerella alba]
MPLQSQKWKLNRRHFLRGLGVSLALPFLECMQPLSSAFGSPSGAAPRRSVFIYLPNGVNTLDYQITQSGKDYRFSRSMKSLEKHRNVITPISGLYHPRGMGQAHNCDQVWLTGGKVSSNSISIDQLMAQQTGVHTRHASLELANSGGGSLAFNPDGIQLPANPNPSHVFRRLFQSQAGKTEQRRRSLQRKGSILDLVSNEANRLERALGKEDKGRLDQYLSSVRDLEIRVTRADAWLEKPLPEIDDQTRKRVDRNPSQEEVGEYFRTMYDLIVLALQTDMTRVVSFRTGAEGKGLAIPEIGILNGRHALSHHGGDARKMEELTNSDTFNLAQFSYFLTRLSETQEGDGTLLDNTMLLYGSGMTYGHSHGNANLPLILAGGKSMGLRHGQHLDFNSAQKEFSGYDLTEAGTQYRICHRPVNSSAHMSNLLLTMGQRMGLEIENFADSSGEVSELIG